MSHLSHPFMTTRKTIALTRWTFLTKVMSLLLNILSRFHHSFSFKEQVSFNFMAAVTIHSDFATQENEVCHCFHCYPIYLLWRDETGWCHLRIWGYWCFSQRSWFQLVLHPVQHVSWCTLHILVVQKMMVWFAVLGILELMEQWRLSSNFAGAAEAGIWL